MRIDPVRSSPIIHELSGIRWSQPMLVLCRSVVSYFHKPLKFQDVLLHFFKYPHFVSSFFFLLIFCSHVEFNQGSEFPVW